MTVSAMGNSDAQIKHMAPSKKKKIMHMAREEYRHQKTGRVRTSNDEISKDGMRHEKYNEN